MNKEQAYKDLKISIGQSVERVKDILLRYQELQNTIPINPEAILIIPQHRILTPDQLMEEEQKIIEEYRKEMELQLDLTFPYLYLKYKKEGDSEDEV